MQSDPVGTLPHYLRVNENDLGLDDGRVFFCAAFQASEQYFFEIDLSPEYFDYAYCRCSSGYYGKPPVNCEVCPENCDCSKGGDKMRWKRGYYPVLNGSKCI